MYYIALSKFTLLIPCGFSFQFIAGHPVDMELVHTSVRPTLLMLGDHRTLNLNVIARLHSLTKLFPHAFNEKLCEQMLVSTGCLTFKEPFFLFVFVFAFLHFFSLGGDGRAHQCTPHITYVRRPSDA